MYSSVLPVKFYSAASGLASQQHTPSPRLPISIFLSWDHGSITGSLVLFFWGAGTGGATVGVIHGGLGFLIVITFFCFVLFNSLILVTTLID